jgi:hypothetical protein
MKKKSCVVTSAAGGGESRPVGTAVFEEFDSVQEALQTLGEERVLKLVNVQHKTNALNAVRAGVSGGLTKSKLKLMAFERLSSQQEKLNSVRGDMTALEALISKTMDEIEKEHKTKQAQALAEVAKELEEEVLGENEEEVKS